MVTDDYKLSEILEHLDCSMLDYQQWTDVGMALKSEGYPCSVWDDWSRSSDPSRYHPGECDKKWQTFRSSGVTAGTIIQMAMDQGWRPESRQRDIALSWDSAIGGGAAAERRAEVDLNWLQEEDVPGPHQPWSPAWEITHYLEALFQPDEFVGICTESYRQEDESRKPTKGQYRRKVKDIIKGLKKWGEDIGKVIGDADPETGAWVRFNPLDGEGVTDKNVTAYRYALIESDSMPIPQQYALLQELKLPIRILVHSGKKSLHAIVKIDAEDYDEYKQRVNWLYDICERNKLKLDRQNRNPSRLSRLPGIMRNGRPQYIVAENLGLPSWADWEDYINGINDDLPDIETFTLENIPPLAPELIEGILREGHKMLMVGPSKAGKSFLLMELAICIAEGKPWLGHQCKKGRVMYVNLEVDDASCKHRMAEICQSMGLDHLSHNLDIWPLRGKAVPMDKLTPKLIRRAQQMDYAAIILDPLYKVITGDENSASEMAKFCNLFDQIAASLHCSMIYCHHHSKGSQGQKRSMDRASGSGVFARDPDALLDLIELVIKPSQREELIRDAKLRIIHQYLSTYRPGWENEAPDDVKSSYIALTAWTRNRIPDAEADTMLERCQKAAERLQSCTGWRMEYTLREFAPHPPDLLWFAYPVHEMDASGTLKDFRADGEKATVKEAREARRAKAEEQKQEQQDRYDQAFANANMGEPPTAQQMADYLGITAHTVRRQLEKFGYSIDKTTTLVRRTDTKKHD